jgi:hypothetical protein
MLDGTFLRGLRRDVREQKGFSREEATRKASGLLA